MNKDTLIAERIFDAPIEKVWGALTNLDEMKKWYFDISEFKLEIGFEFQFQGENECKVYIHKCKILEVIQNKKLSYSWSYEDYPGNSILTFDLFKFENKTKLVITHEGLETFPQENPNFAKTSFEEGWNYIIGISLKQYLELI